ncbi:MAG TPA: hypothetical protein VJW55_13640 [Candidatus Angelobacter sp.]|nr:hypothetical protein [Candidatus Angelobacter sp.]
MTLKKYWIAAIAASMLSMGAVAQVSAGGSASGNASVTPGQAGASASANQSTNAGQAGASTSTSANQTANVGSVANAGSAANTGSAANVGSSSAALSSGTAMQAELTKSLDAKKAKPGDQVTAKLTQDVKQDGKVVLHKGSKLKGHVTEAQAKSKENAESKLGIVFDKAELKGGQEVAFNGVIQALAPPVAGSLSLAGDESSTAGAGMGAPSAPSMGGGARGGGTLGAATGAVSPAVGSTVGAVGRTAGSATGAVNNTVGGAANATLNTTSRGVVGLQGLALNTAAAGSAQGSVISSADKTVKLDSGTQMVLQVAGAASAQ